MSYSVTTFSIYGLGLDSINGEDVKAEGDASYQSKINDGHKFYNPTWTWGCSNCREHAGMTTFIESCPGCGHVRCADCRMEHVLHRDDRMGKHSVLPMNALLSNALEIPWRLNACPVRSLSAEITPVTGTTAENNKASHLSNRSNLSTPTTTSSPASVESSPSAHSSPQTIFTERSIDLDTETDVETDETDEDERGNDGGQMSEHESEAPEDVFDILEFHLMSILGHDFDFIAEIIPRIHESIQNGFPNHDGSFTLVPGHGESGSRNGAPATSHNTSQSRGGVLAGPNGGRQLGGHCQQNQRAKKTKTSLRIQRQDRRQRQVRTFACPFHKNNPRKYHPLNDVNYRTCFGPGPAEHELRRMKYHFQEQHYSPRGGESEISDDQWKEIEQFLRLRKGRPPPGEREWYSIWKILFPGIPEPPSPYDKFELYPRDLESVIDVLSRIYEHDVGCGFVQQDNASYDYFVQSLRQAYQSAITGVLLVPGSLADPMELNENQISVPVFPIESSSQNSPPASTREPDPPSPLPVPHEGMPFDSAGSNIANSIVSTTDLSSIEAKTRAHSPDLDLPTKLGLPDLNLHTETPSFSQHTNQHPEYSDFGFETRPAIDSLTPDFLMLDDESLDIGWDLGSPNPWKADSFNHENDPIMGREQEDDIPSSVDILGIEDQQFDLDYRNDNALAAYLQSENESMEAIKW